MKKIFLAVLVLAMAACSSPTPHFFQPEAVKTVDISYSAFKDVVLINNVLLPAEVARPQITTLGKENFELKIDEFNRWGAAPEKMLQRVLNEDLSQLMPNATFENQTPLRKNYKYAVATEVMELNGRLDEKATLKASYYIKNKMGKTIKSGRFDQTIAIDGYYAAYVAAQSKLWGEFAAAIAKDLAGLK